MHAFSQWKVVKTTDSCPTGEPISVVFSDIYMCKMEFDVEFDLIYATLLFYKCYVDYTCVRRKKNITDMLFEDFNSYH